MRSAQGLIENIGLMKRAIDLVILNTLQYPCPPETCWRENIFTNQLGQKGYPVWVLLNVGKNARH